MREFQPDTPIVWMAERSVPPAAERRRHVLWPAWAYAVLAPPVGDRPSDRLDIFERSLLRLFRAGVRDTREAAALMCLDPRLTAYIAVALEDQKLCTKKHVLSEHGERALAESDDLRETPVRGYVFQDPDSGSMWGRFVEQVQYVDADWSAPNRLRLMLGTTGSPYSPMALAVRPGPRAAAVPVTARHVLEAVRAHRQASARSRSDDDDLEVENIQRTQVISSQPLPVWLATVIYAADLDEEGAAWNVIDPFGLGRSPYLRALVEHRARDADAASLANLLDAVTAPANAADAPADRRRTEYARDVLASFDAALAGEPLLREELLDVVVAAERAEGSPRPRDHAQVLDSARQAVETALARWLPSGRHGDLAQDLIGDRDQDAVLLRRQAGAIGLEDVPGPDNLFVTVAARQIRDALDGRDLSLRPLALALVLIAAGDPGHPLRAAAQRRPSLLADLDFIALGREPSDDVEALSDPPPSARISDLTLAVVDLLLTATHPVPDGALHGQ